MFIQDDPWRRTTNFEQEELLNSISLLGGKVARTYVISVPSASNIVDTSRHILINSNYGSSACNWTLNEPLFQDLDNGLRIANLYKIKLIVPFIDNYEFWGGIQSFSSLYGRQTADFYSNPVVINGFKRLISLILNRNNTLTGILYKDDPSIMAWETGNEISPTNSSWTLDIAAHIKLIDTNHLVIDGRYGVDPLSVTSDYIDIISSHYYPLSVSLSTFYPSEQAAILICLISFIALTTLLLITTIRPSALSILCSPTPLKTDDISIRIVDRKRKLIAISILSSLILISVGLLAFFLLNPFLIRGLDYSTRISSDASKCNGKPFLVGELGLAPVSSISKAFQNYPSGNVCGILMWSLRGKQASGSVYTHSEGGGYYAYHFPALTSGFGVGSDEVQIVNLIQKAAARSA